MAAMGFPHGDPTPPIAKSTVAWGNTYDVGGSSEKNLNFGGALHANFTSTCSLCQASSAGWLKIDEMTICSTCLRLSLSHAYQLARQSVEQARRDLRKTCRCHSCGRRTLLGHVWKVSSDALFCDACYLEMVEQAAEKKLEADGPGRNLIL